MRRIHFLNVLEGDCNIIQHSSGRVTMIDICNARADKPIEEMMKMESFIKTASRGVYGNFNQKKYPANPITYLDSKSIETLWRFVLTHPDMDHLDGFKDLYDSRVTINNFWDTQNKKEINNFGDYGQYRKEDWEFYKSIRDSKNIESGKYLRLLSGNTGDYWTEDGLKILAPTSQLIEEANKNDDYNDSSYVILYKTKRDDERTFKILFAGDSHNRTWEHILDTYKDDVTNIDVLIAPHHGRDSDRDYSFVKHLNPTVTLFGNAKSKDLAYGKYPHTIISNNQAGNIIMKISDAIYFYCSNKTFADAYRKNKNWPESQYSYTEDAYFLFNIGSE